jgi:hypothetical protein
MTDNTTDTADRLADDRHHRLAGAEPDDQQAPKPWRESGTCIGSGACIFCEDQLPEDATRDCPDMPAPASG